MVTPRLGCVRAYRATPHAPSGHGRRKSPPFRVHPRRLLPMLILTRRIGETLMIGDDTRITVCAADGLQVKLGIAAPRTTQVHRQEIYERIQAGEAKPLAPADKPASSRRARFLAHRPTHPPQG